METVGIISTASLPWFTGTSIIPLNQAVYLNKRGYKSTLYVPWLKPSHQKRCFKGHVFSSPDEQIDYIRNWISEELRPHFPTIRFYPAIYSKKCGSIIPFGNPARVVSQHDAIVTIDPGHLFALYPWSKIRKKQKFVVGEVMTNYEYFFSPHMPRFFAKKLQAYNRFIMQRMSHRLAPISPAQEDICALPSCSVVPLNAADAQLFQKPPSTRNNQCYFIGKLIPEKGLAEMFHNLKASGVNEIDLYGSGDKNWVEQSASECKMKANLKGIIEKSWEVLPEYKIFVNCSKSEHMCSTSLQALAMQQWLIVPEHPSNNFYYSFKNCLTYTTQDEFVQQLHYAQTHEPVEDPNIFELSYDAAVERLIRVIQEYS